MINKQHYSNHTFDKATHLRDIAEYNPISSAILFWKGDFFLKKENNVTQLFIEIPVEYSNLNKIFLGLKNEKEIWCIDLSDIEEDKVKIQLNDPSIFLSEIRNFSLQLTQEEAALLSYSKGIIEWNQQNIFCPACGHKTRVAQKGHSKICSNHSCKKQHFPRINPAVIVVIEHISKNKPAECLLNLKVIDGKKFCFLFAGFMEVGESIEDTAKREMMEELHLDIDNIEYVASQPWSFSSSLMLGLTANTNSRAFKIEPTEIEEAQWFTAKELREQLDNEELFVLAKDSISSFLIHHWLNKNV